MAPAIMSFSICPVFLNHPSYSFGKLPEAPPKNMRTDVPCWECCRLDRCLDGRNEAAKPWTAAWRVATIANAPSMELLILKLDVFDPGSRFADVRPGQARQQKRHPDKNAVGCVGGWGYFSILTFRGGGGGEGGSFVHLAFVSLDKKEYVALSSSPLTFPGAMLSWILSFGGVRVRVCRYGAF